MKTIIKSYAKINLHLEILRKRSDNYHDLFSIMAELDLCDVLTLKEWNFAGVSGPVFVDVQNEGGDSSSVLDDIPSEKNLITIAVKEYMARMNLSGKLIFGLKKNIPSGAGLGGGSSNAAAALKLVSGLLGKSLDENVYKAASSTGSDVPFFLTGGFAFVEGRGETVLPIEYTDESFVLLVNNGIHIDTGSAYRSLNKTVTDELPDCTSIKKNISDEFEKTKMWKKMFRNDFEPNIFSIHPQLELVKNTFYDCGAFFSAMTGTGSTVFGIFHERNHALNALKVLEGEGNRVYFTKFRKNKN